jgi:DNA-binding transcriptional ArsR family regulator
MTVVTVADRLATLDKLGVILLVNHMVNYKNQTEETNPLDAVFGALADPTRRAIVARLAEGPAKVTDLAAPFAMSLPAVSKHLKVLERAGLLARDRQGRVHHCRLDPARFDEAQAWIEQTRAFWEDRLDDLERYLEKDNQNGSHGGNRSDS